MATILDKNFKPQAREVKYLGRDFNQIKQNLINFAKQYYPKSYKDFSEASPGMMFIDMASYVGDVLSFYIDYQFKEGLIEFSEERKNVINLAKYLGYTTKPSKPSITTLDLYMIAPAKRNLDGKFSPDERYMVSISEGMEVVSSTGVSFLTTDEVNFSLKSELFPRTDEVFSRNDVGEPEFYLLKKSVQAYSGKKITKSVIVGSDEPNLRIEFAENNIIKILNVKDADNNTWYQVDYMAQDLISLSVENNQYDFEKFSKFKSTVPNIIRFLRTNRRFTVNVDENNKTFLQFGPSTDSIEEELLVPNSDNIGVGFSNISKYNLTLDPTSFLKSNAYGLSPFNTTLEITYVVGGGIESNVNVGDITKVSKIEFIDLQEYLPTEAALIGTIKNSLKVENSISAIGGSGPETIEEIKNNAIFNFAAQDRIVTKEDYIARVFSMSPEYGKIAKAYVTTENDLYTNNTSFITGLIDKNNNIIVDEKNKDFRKINLDGVNPNAINLYVLTYNENKNLEVANEALTYNLRNYLSRYRMLSDRINIIDAFIINIGVNFTLLTYSNYNKKEVLNNCIDAVKNFFNIDLWQISQPININQLELEIAKIEGVQSVADLEIVNIIDSGYSICEYDLKSATKNKIIYPPIDPAIFEIKNPDIDIKGRTL